MYKAKTTREKGIERFQYQEELIKSQLMHGEDIKHCIDNSQNRKFYNPLWVVTSKGRVWSLWGKKWLKIKLKMVGVRNKNQEYAQQKYYVDGKVEVAVLVAFYFCDKLIVNQAGYDKCSVHHKRRFNELLSNEENNNRNNLCYQLTEDHNKIINNLQNSKKPKEFNCDNTVDFMIHQMAYNEGSEVYFDYKADGKKELITRIKLKGTTAADEEELRRLMGDRYVEV